VTPSYTQALRERERERERESREAKMGVILSKICMAREARRQKKAAKKIERQGEGFDGYIYTARRGKMKTEYTPLGQERVVLRRVWHRVDVVRPPMTSGMPVRGKQARPTLDTIQEDKPLPVAPATEEEAETPQSPIRPSSTYARPDGFSDRTMGTVMEDEVIRVDLYPVANVGRPPIFRNESPVRPLSAISRRPGSSSPAEVQPAPTAVNDEMSGLWRDWYSEVWNQRLRDESPVSPTREAVEGGTLARPSCPVGQEEIGIAL
jgi:hypothetical protein